EIIYGQRNTVLDGEDIHETVLKMVKDTITDNVNSYLSDELKDNWNMVGLREYYGEWLIKDDSKYALSLEQLEELDKQDIVDMLVEDAMALYEENEKLLPQELMREIERVYLLRSVDTHWMEHIDNMEQLKQGIRLRSYGQHDPVVEYRLEGFDMFDEMIMNIREDTVKLVLTMPKKIYEAQKQQVIAQQMAQAQAQQNATEQPQEPKTAPKPAPGPVVIKRQQVAQPVQTSGDGTDSRNRTVVKGKKIGRNDPCPCGSGKKYKKCCGRDE
ncbi:MAG: SEC-C metal-binding domain-containing protein, partial [Ruminiclostridium sp.]